MRWRTRKKLPARPGTQDIEEKGAAASGRLPGCLRRSGVNGGGPDSVRGMEQPARGAFQTRLARRLPGASCPSLAARAQRGKIAIGGEPLRGLPPGESTTPSPASGPALAGLLILGCPMAHRRETGGVFVARPDCVLPHVNSPSMNVVGPSRGTSRRAYSSELGL